VSFEPKKGGVRTAIDLFPVHVHPKRGAETPRSRLRGVGERILKKGLDKSGSIYIIRAHSF